MDSPQANDILEEGTCPICFEVLIGQVLQCHRGHIICQSCLNSVTVCPQCRIQYSSPPIRNRALEGILDRLRFDCKFKSKGCSARLERGNIAAHARSCPYSGTQFRICGAIGLKCDSKYAQHGATHDAVFEHLRNSHKIEYICRETDLVTSVRLHLNGLGLNSDLTSVVKTHWTPIIYGNGLRKLLLAPVLTVHNGTLNVEMTLLQLSANIPGTPTREVEFRLEPRNSTTNQTIRWKQNGVLVRDCTFWRPSQGVFIDLSSDVGRLISTNGMLIFCRFVDESYSRNITIKPISKSTSEDQSQCLFWLGVVFALFFLLGKTGSLLLSVVLLLLLIISLKGLSNGLL